MGKKTSLDEIHLTPTNKNFAYDADTKNYFAKIVSGEAKADAIFETEHTIAILDGFPNRPGHAMLITKRHYASVLDMPADIAAEYFRELPRLARIVQAATGAEGIHIAEENGKVANQHIFQVHTHVVPRHVDKRRDPSLGNNAEDIRYPAIGFAGKKKSQEWIDHFERDAEGLLKSQFPDWVDKNPWRADGSLKNKYRWDHDTQGEMTYWQTVEAALTAWRSRSGKRRDQPFKRFPKAEAQEMLNKMKKLDTEIH